SVEGGILSVAPNDYRAVFSFSRRGERSISGFSVVSEKKANFFRENRFKKAQNVCVDGADKGK
ncbi:MAG: hypothetical protein IJY15_12260, partial [Thermoguttaceae bacterium]|nr:hypothetical protein [Thermoguttaceae bacterium]